VRGVLVDLLDDREGWLPLTVEYVEPSEEQSLTYMVKERHPHLASPVRTVAVGRGMKLAVKLHLPYIVV
jgi:hypothetical protein